MLGWRPLILSSCILALAVPASAQREHLADGPIARAVARQATELAARPSGEQESSPDPAWSRAIAFLSPDVQVRATLDDGKAVRGRFRSADDDAVTVSVDGADRQLARQRVRQLAVATGTRRKRHENIGMAIGGIIGTIALERRCRGQSSNCYEEAMLCIGGLMLNGGWIGHALPKGTAWREIYRRAS